MYKEIDLFGNETIRFAETKRKTKNLFTDHDGFVEKFETKKTTDDCYTPKEVFDIVLNYVNEKCDIQGKRIIRPFFPGGDFESIEYPADCVVIDNPPFSIISKIVRFYIDQNVQFFLFAPHLTLFSSDVDCTHIVVGGNIIYENGAVVKTSFLSNMFGDVKIVGDSELYEKFRELESSSKANLPKYTYPANVVTVSSIQWMVEKGVSIQISKKDAAHCRGLASQKTHKKALFGSGFLVSEKAAAEKAAAEKAAAEKAAAEKAAAEKVNHIEWALSEKEWRIIQRLG
jgi:hypothetical protein